MRAPSRTLLAGLLTAAAARAAQPWPAEAHTSAVALTSVDAGLNTVNWSGASWDPDARALWLACNSGHFWKLVEQGAGGFSVATNAAGAPAKWSPGGDLESICTVGSLPSSVFLMDEAGWIREYDTSHYGVVAPSRAWDIRAQCPAAGGAGAEGLAFVPDPWLQRQGFRTANGDLYTSTNGMGGLMFVGHQNGGFIHVFDLNRTHNSLAYLGRYKTGRSESAGLEFDAAGGILYIWHNVGSSDNYLELVELSSYVDGADRRFRTIAEYAGPRTGNLEGFALAPPSSTGTWCVVTDDNNDGGEAVMWYRQFPPGMDADGDALPDAWERWHFGSITQAVAAGDADHDGSSNADEFTADTDPRDGAASFPTLRFHPGDGPPSLHIEPTSTARIYHIAGAADLSGDWSSITDAVGSGGPWIVDAPPASSNAAFFRSAVTVP